MFPVISVVGWHNVGKTTLVEELVRRLKTLGYCVATIKHAHLAPSLDQPGTDTFRYGEAGSDVIGLVSHGVITLQLKSEHTPALSNLLARVPQDADFVIIEGYKNSTLPKIEVHEPGRPEPITKGSDVLALVERGEGPAPASSVVDRVMSLLSERGFVDKQFA